MLKITGVKIPITADFSLPRKLVADTFGIKENAVSSASLVRRSLDARKKTTYIMSVALISKLRETRVHL